MIHFLSRTALGLILFLVSTSLFAQQSILERFEANTVNEQVVLTWTIKQGFTCNGIRIERSPDSLIYLEIGDIEGICGSLTEPENYTFIDKSPLSNQRNYYRLELGAVELSSVVSSEVYLTGETGHLIIPNPSQGNQMTIFYKNQRNAETALRVYDQHGHLVITQSSRGETYDLFVEGFQPGLYLFIISYSDKKEISRGKLILY
ncbi:MAG: T9SS type A sorting domain-containing protein [Vicingaceae bacterium]